MLSIRTHDSGVSFSVHVQPRSSHNKVVGLHGDALKLKLTAPPVEGQANEACLAYLSSLLGVSRSALEILAGPASRKKLILLHCPSEKIPAFRQQLLDLAQQKKAG